MDMKGTFQWMFCVHIKGIPTFSKVKRIKQKMVMIEFIILVYCWIFNCWECLLKYRLLIFVGVPILSSKSVWSVLVWTCKRFTVGFRKLWDQVNFKNGMKLSRLGFAYIVEEVLSTIFTVGTLQLYPVLFLQKEEAHNIVCKSSLSFCYVVLAQVLYPCGHTQQLTEGIVALHIHTRW